MGRGLRALQDIRLIDLSVSLSSETAEPDPPRIDYVDHRRSASELAVIATHLMGQSVCGPEHLKTIVTEDAFQDHLGMANENLQLDTHAGTHMDAPWHFGPLCENKSSKTIDQIPLEWCLGPGVVLDLRFKKPGELILKEDLELALERIHYALKPRDIVLVMTGADKHYTQPDYFSAHAGMGKEATLWLLDQGIKVIGIDSWGFDRPAIAMLQDYVDAKEKGEPLFPAHMVGRQREYCHIEKMANFDQIPVPYGFWVSCFPVKVERGSAGWVRAVALVAAAS